MTASDLAELERMLTEAGACRPEDIERAKNENSGLGLFVRGLIGLDRQAAKRAFASFLEAKKVSSSQIEFINLVIDHLTEQGVMTPAQLYESPFTDIAPQGPEALFPGGQVDELIHILDSVRARAEA